MRLGGCRESLKVGAYHPWGVPAVGAIHDADIVTAQEMEYETFDYIESFYKPVRRHSALKH